MQDIIISLVWMNCQTEEKTLVGRARRIQFFLSTKKLFNVAEQFTRSTKISYVPVAEAVRSFKEIMKVNMIIFQGDAFRNVGPIEDVVAKLSYGLLW